MAPRSPVFSPTGGASLPQLPSLGTVGLPVGPSGLSRRIGSECPASCWHPPLSPGEPSSAPCWLSGPRPRCALVSESAGPEPVAPGRGTAEPGPPPPPRAAAAKEVPAQPEMKNTPTFRGALPPRGELGSGPTSLGAWRAEGCGPQQDRQLTGAGQMEGRSLSMRVDLECSLSVLYYALG